MAQETVIITGGGSGIGLATAWRFHRRGRALGVIDIDRDAAEAVARDIRADGGTAHAETANVALEAELQGAVNRCQRALPGIRTVVAAAGITRASFVHKMPLEEWQRVLAVNLTGTFLLAKATVPLLLAAGGGSFVAISSYAGLRGAVGHAAYCASKHGVIGLVRAMALDYGDRGIRSNAVCPGFVDTPMARQIFDAAPPGTEEAIREAVPLSRFALPEEVADIIVHLSSAEASYVNGIAYSVDGGSSVGNLNGKPRTPATAEVAGGDE